MTVASRLAVALLLGLHAAAAADEPPEDPIGKKLAAAKKEYAAETAKALKAAGDALERAEGSARKKGDRVGLAKVKEERKSLDEHKEFPASAAAALRKKMSTLQARVEVAHQQAIRDYTRAGDDAKATAASKSLADLRSRFVGAVQLEPRKVYRIVNRNSGLALALKSPQSPKDSPLVQAPAADDPLQLWTAAAFQHEGATVYAIRNVGCGMAITVDDYSRNRGAPIVVFPEASEMRWRVSPRRGGLTLQWILSGLVISVTDASKEPGARVIQWPEHPDSLDQIWNFIEVDVKGR